MKVQRGDIVLVDFPYSNHRESKVRPALVIQSDVWNQRLDTTILASITSSHHRRVGASTQYFIDTTTAEGQQSGLRFDLIVQCENLITHEQELILRVIGSFPDSVMQRINECLKTMLSIL
jgi:mRNA interferase MazF